MPAYYIGQITIHEPENFQKYLSDFISAFTKFSGRVLVSSEDVEVIEGKWPRTRTIVFEFPSEKHAKDWYHSEDYQSIVKYRHQSAAANIILVKGFGE